MNKYIFYFALMLFFFGISTERGIFAQGNLQSAINQYIAKQAKADGSSEYKNARKVLTGDLDGDGDKDAVVQFSLEGAGGGNNWSQMMAVFINNKGIYKFAGEEVVGGKFFDYTSTLSNVGKGIITLNTETCAEPPQGLCENPKKGVAKFLFKQGKLVKG